MKDFSFDSIQNAANEVYRFKEQSKFSDEDINRYKCNCRFEKEKQECSPSQNGKNCYIKSNSFDDDKMLILALILILSKNSDDKMLLFALLYLIM